MLLPVLDPHPDTERGGEAGEHGALRQVAHVVQHALPGGQQLLHNNSSFIEQKTIVGVSDFSMVI